MILESIDSINLRIQELQKQLCELEIQRDQELARTELVCRKCRRTVAVNQTVFVQNHFYVPPSARRENGSASEGYLTPTDAHWECSCGTANRMTPEVQNLRKFFLAVRDDHFA